MRRWTELRVVFRFAAAGDIPRLVSRLPALGVGRRLFLAEATMRGGANNPSFASSLPLATLPCPKTAV